MGSPLYTPENDEARFVEEGDSTGYEYRSNYRRDYARIIHCGAFRRLQGKTQLFPVLEMDFFRNRLTHSLEVAQIAKSICLYLNDTNEVLNPSSGIPINADIVEAASMAHDIGLPPFGHRGEKALHSRMTAFGGFEGNAQTLRILSRLEKKRIHPQAPTDAVTLGVSSDGTDYRVGLNLTARTLAAVLKVDQMIPASDKDSGSVDKGYYAVDREIVDFVRKRVVGDRAPRQPLLTVECQVMDIADDIAYSTYDLEDALKGGFVTPIELLSLDDRARNEVASEAKKALDKTLGEDSPSSLQAEGVLKEILKVFSGILSTSKLDAALRSATAQNKDTTQDDIHVAAIYDVMETSRASRELASSGYRRTSLATDLVGDAVKAVDFQLDPTCAPLSKVSLDKETRIRVEILKRLIHRAVVLSPRLKVADYRGGWMINRLLDELESENGKRLLPADFLGLYERAATEPQRYRVLSDFVAGMTDVYALELIGSLTSSSGNGYTVFRPRT